MRGKPNIRITWAQTENTHLQILTHYDLPHYGTGTGFD